MKTKLILCDFDGTITQTDVLDLMCDLVGKRDISQQINARFIAKEKDGKEALIERFSLLEGLELSKIYEALENVPLTNGAEEFFAYAARHGIQTLILSGNASFVLEYYRKKLQFSVTSGSRIYIRDGMIQPWDPAHCSCVDKQMATLSYIKAHGVKKEQILAIGDSIADQALFELAGTSFLINKKGQVSADYEISSFNDIIAYLEREVELN